MSPGTILLAAISACFFWGAFMGLRWLLRRLERWMRDMDDARERRIEAIREADRRGSID